MTHTESRIIFSTIHFVHEHKIFSLIPVCGCDRLMPRCDHKLCCLTHTMQSHKFCLCNIYTINSKGLVKLIYETSKTYKYFSLPEKESCVSFEGMAPVKNRRFYYSPCGHQVSLWCTFQNPIAI